MNIFGRGPTAPQPAAAPLYVVSKSSQTRLLTRSPTRRGAPQKVHPPRRCTQLHDATRIPNIVFVSTTQKNAKVAINVPPKPMQRNTTLWSLDHLEAATIHSPPRRGGFYTFIVVQSER